MKTRNEDYSALKHDNVPSICYYQPKYGLVTKKQPSVIPYDKPKSKSKHYQLNKLWRSYDISLGYKLVNI